MVDDLGRDFLLLKLVDNVLMTRRDFPKAIGCLERACEMLRYSKVPNCSRYQSRASYSEHGISILLGEITLRSLETLPTGRYR